MMSMKYILNEGTTLKNKKLLKDDHILLKKIKFEINYFIKNQKNYLLNIYLAKLYKFYKDNNQQNKFFKYINKKLKALENLNSLTKLVFYKYKLIFYLFYKEVFNIKGISERKRILERNFYKDLKNIFSLIINYILNLLKEVVIISYDLKAYEFIFSFKLNNDLVDFEERACEKLAKKNDFNITKLKKLLYLIFLVYRELHFLDKMDLQDFKNITNLKLFLFYIGFFKEYLYYLNYQNNNNYNDYNVDSYENVYQNLINSFISIIDEIIK